MSNENIIGYGLQTNYGVTTVFPYHKNGDVTGGDNFWPTREGAQDEADRQNASSHAEVSPDA